MAAVWGQPNAAAVEAEVAGGTLLLGGRDADLGWLTGCIQALRAKTAEQGCAEQEALTAAQKVAETGRKRVGSVDDCVPSIAAFSDCRAWGEKGLVARSPRVLRPARGRRGDALPV